MDIEEYRQLWKEAIHLCEIEPNEEEATSFVWRYNNKSVEFFSSMDDRTLLLTFVGLVVYEQKYHMKFGSTIPAAFCYQELLARAKSGRMDREFVFDVGDWAAAYSDNCYVPMCTYRGYGPRQYYKFWADYEARVWEEKEAARIRKEKLLAEGREKVEAAKRRHQERLMIIQLLREKPIDESLRIIEQSEKPVFYYIDLIEEWFKNNSLSKGQKNKILSLFPSKSTRHNNRLRKFLVSLS